MFFAIDDIGKNKWPSAEFPDWLHLAGFSRNALQHFCKVPTNSEPYHDGWRYATQPYDLSIDETEELLNKSRTHGIEFQLIEFSDHDARCLTILWRKKGV